jgi:hypothetical protein
MHFHLIVVDVLPCAIIVWSMCMSGFDSMKSAAIIGKGLAPLSRSTQLQEDDITYLQKDSLENRRSQFWFKASQI